jgi:hypothetical protein
VTLQSKSDGQDEDPFNPVEVREGRHALEDEDHHERLAALPLNPVKS